MKTSVKTGLILLAVVSSFFLGRVSVETGISESRDTQQDQPVEADASLDRSAGSAIAAERDQPQGSSGRQAPLITRMEKLADAWRDQDLVMPDGRTEEEVVFDLRELSFLLAGIESATPEQLADLREITRRREDTEDEGRLMEVLMTLPILGRDIELRGRGVLDETLERAATDSHDPEYTAFLLLGAYTLALQDPIQAEEWFHDTSQRTDLEKLRIDIDRVRASLDKAAASR